MNKEKKIIGITCSTFDLLHAGHIIMLEECKKYCDFLICALQVRFLSHAVRFFDFQVQCQQLISRNNGQWTNRGVLGDQKRWWSKRIAYRSSHTGELTLHNYNFWPYS